MLNFYRHLRAGFAALWVAGATAWGAVDISDLQVSNVGTTAVTVSWTTSEVSTPGLQVFSDSAGTTAVTAGLALDYYPFAEGDPGVVNSSVARASRRELEVLAINRRVVVVRVSGLVPGTTYYLRPRTFGAGGADNGSGLLALRAVKTASVTSMVTDGRLLRLRFPGLVGAGLVALVEGPAGASPVSSFIGDGVAADSAVIPLAGFIDPVSGTNSVLEVPTQLTIRLLGSGAPSGTFTQTIDFGAVFRPAGVVAAELGGANPSPIFTVHPESRTLVAGVTATFSATATGTPAPTYQWQRLPSGAAVWADLANDGTYSGVGTGTLTIPIVTLAMSGDQFRSVATNGVLPNATSNAATLTVTPAAPTFVNLPPTPAVAVQGLNFFYGPVTINPTIATFSATGFPTGLQIDAANGSVSGTPNVGGPFPMEFAVVLRVENAAGFDTRNLTIRVNSAPPQVSSPVAASGQVGTDFSYTIVATNSPTSYGASGLPAGLVLNETTGLITGRPSTAGTFEVTLTAVNSGGSTSHFVVLTIAPAPSAPVYTGIADPSGTQGTAFSFVPLFTGTPTAYVIASGALPAGLELNATTGAITGIPTAVGEFQVTLRATNPGGNTDVNLRITVNPAPAAPVITSASAAATTVGENFSFTLTAEGVPASYTFGATNLPAWLNLNSSTGVLSGTAVLGTYAVNVYASNSPSAGVTLRGPEAVLVITVSASPNAPVISSAAVVQGRVNVNLSYQLTSTPTANSFAITSATPPDWLQLNATTGAVSGTPNAAGQMRVVFAANHATFGQGTGLEVLFDIAPALLAPVILSGGTAQGQVGQPFNYQLIASGDGITGYAISGPLPAGLGFSPTTGLISGIPSTATTTPASVLLTALNAAGSSDPLRLEISIVPPPATPVIMSPLEVSGRVGEAFNYQIVASDSPTSYAASSLPGGLAVNPTSGLISGTPTLAGIYSVPLRVANANGLGTEVTLRITIVPALASPRIVSLPAAMGQAGVSFSYRIEAEPGPILSFGLTGSLPSGLSLNTGTGIISGRPVQSGLFTVRLTATNSSGVSLPQPFILLIRPSLGVPVITSPNIGLATVGESFGYVITATNMPPGRPFVAPSQLNAAGLPSGLAVNPAQGVIEGIPTTPGLYRVRLSGTNAAGTGAVRDLNLIVQPAPAAPRISSPPTLAGQVGVPLRYFVTASNAPRAYEAIGAPAWLAVNSRTGELSGIPTAPGAHELLLVATNNSGRSDSQKLLLQISAGGGTPVITSSQTALGGLNADFTYVITATPAATSYVVTGLPAGLNVNEATGVISGKPLSSGRFKVSLVAVNAAGAGAATTLVIQITATARLDLGL